MKKKESLIERLGKKGKIRTIQTNKDCAHLVAEYGISDIAIIPGHKVALAKEIKKPPKINHNLRKRLIVVPEVIYEASGINILEKKIKSIIFTTDIAIIKNSNADAIMAVYPFTPQISINNAILDTSMVPVFVGIGGAVTSGKRSLNIGLQAELYGAYGVVVNSPIEDESITQIASELDIPVIATVASENTDYKSKIKAGAQILNISAGSKTAELVKKIRNDIGDDFPIIATGGTSEESIRKTIKAGANAITYSPPSTAEIFENVMEEYRIEERKNK